MNKHPSSAMPPGSLRAALTMSLLVVALLLSACGSRTDTTTQAASVGTAAGLSIVATTTILADVTSEVARDDAEVTTLMEAGSDPHIFAASAQQLARMQEADLIVANGAGLEEHLLGPLDEAERAGVPVFHATDHIETLAFGEDDHEGDDHEDGHDHEDGQDDEHEDGHDHAVGSVDPHFWMDPIRMADVARALGERIGELSGDAAEINARAGDYATRLADLDHEITETLAPVPDGARTLVTNHEAFNYFADRYGFTIVGTVIPSLSTGAEPSAQDMEELAHIVEEQQVRAVFAENTAPGRLAQTLATEAGTDVAVVELYSDSLGAEGSGADTYAGMLSANAELVRNALAG